MIIFIILIICIVVGGKYLMNASAGNSFTSDLLPDERVLAVCRKNWTCFFNRKSIIGWFIGFLLVYIFIPGIFAFIISLPCALIPSILEYKNTELVLTNERLRGKQGAFNIRTVENKASYFVGNVKTESNAILSSLGSDTIIIESRGVAPFVFTHMKDAAKMSSALYSLGSEQEIHIVNKF